MRIGSVAGEKWRIGKRKGGSGPVQSEVARVVNWVKLGKRKGLSISIPVTGIYQE